MTSTASSTPGRPATLWVAAGLLLVLAFLSCVGGYLFNLSGADDPSEFVVGGLFVALGAAYFVTALKLPGGDPVWRTVALGLTISHGLFNLIVKVGIERETESLMFVVLTAAVIATLLMTPRLSPARRTPA